MARPGWVKYWRTKVCLLQCKLVVEPVRNLFETNEPIEEGGEGLAANRYKVWGKFQSQEDLNGWRNLNKNLKDETKS